MPKYDIVIIGSGLGGLECGNILSKEGKNVCILEKQPQFGGNLQTFSRNGVIFETGVHYVGGLSKGKNLHQYFKYFNIIDKLKLRRLDINAFDKINFEGKEYSYAQGYKNFVKTLLKDFPLEKKALKRYVKKIKEICCQFPIYNISPKEFSESEKQYDGISVTDFLKSITTNKTLQNVLAGSNMLYAGVPDKTPIAIHALITNSLIEGAYRFEGGSQQIADLLVETIKDNGGTLMKNSEVKKLEVKDGKIESAILNNGDVIEGDYFISAIHPSPTLELIDNKIIRKAYRSRINAIEETASVFTVYFSLKPDSFKYLNYNYYHFNEDTVWTLPSYNQEKWPQEYLFLTLPNANSTKFAKTASAMAYMQYNEVKRWENSKVGKRGNDYENFKKQKAEKLINIIENQYPGFKSCIDNYYTSTPLTIKAYTGSKNGSLYGILHDCNNPLKTHISPKTKIPNLLLTGQNIKMHGVIGVTIGSIITCAEILGMKYLSKKIRNA